MHESGRLCAGEGDMFGMGKPVQGQLVESNQMTLAYEKRSYEKRESEGGRLGCTLVTGFLGSGKTTLVHHILHNRGDMRIAVLVDEFAEIDIDSVLLDRASMNGALGLPSLSLSSGCGCCTISGNMQDAVRSVLSSKHNFDYLVIETSGVADPERIAEEVEGAGVHLDMIVTVVDAEALDSILDLPVAKKQLVVADIVLVNKCDVASLSTISGAEDRVEAETGGTKAVRCRFCKVPVSLVMNVHQRGPAAPLTATLSNGSSGFLSHEAMASSGCGASSPAMARASSHWDSSSHTSHEKLTMGDKVPGGVVERCTSGADDGPPAAHCTSAFVSCTFCSDVPVSLAQFQDMVLKQMQGMQGLLRAKGVIWFSDFRHIRFLFHWSGKKRVEAVYGGKWDSPPHSRLVFIGRDGCEVGQLVESLRACSSNVDEEVKAGCGGLEDEVGWVAHEMSLDERFKVYDMMEGTRRLCAVTFGLVAAPLRGVNEADLNAALMRVVNGRGVVFLAGVTPRNEGHVLQVSLSRWVSAEVVWREVLWCAATVLARGFKDVCPCRCDMTMHTH